MCFVLVGFLVRRLSHHVQEDYALLDFDLFLAVVRFRCAFAVLLGYDLDLDAVDTANQLRLEYRFTFLLAALVSRTRAAAVDAGGDRDAVHLEGLVAVDRYKKTIQAVRQSYRNLGRDLEVGMSRIDNDSSAVLGLLLVGEDLDSPWLG